MPKLFSILCDKSFFYTGIQLSVSISVQNQILINFISGNWINK